MKFTSPVYSAVSGSIAGLTYAHNRGGMYARQRTIPTDPATARQLEMRDILSGLVTSWGTVLTAAQRAAWDLYGENVPTTGPLGGEVLLSGQQWFIACNSIRVQAARFLGVADSALLVNNGPTTFNRTNLTLSAGTPDASDQQISQPYVADEARTQDGGLILFYQSRPAGPGVNYFRGPWRLSFVVVGDTATPPTSPAVIDTPGYVLTEGLNSWVRAVASAPDARSSPQAIDGPRAVQA